MTATNRMDSVGWVFFWVVLALYTPLCIYLVLAITVESLGMAARAGTGVCLAFFAAAFTSWLANSILSYRAQRLDAREAATRAASGKKKRSRASEK